MFDEFERLLASESLARLLVHYGLPGAVDRESWQDRLMQLDGVPSRDLTDLHGELLAYKWIEQNTGVVPLLRDGAVPCCYRITPAGQRALKRLQSRHQGHDEADAA